MKNLIILFLTAAMLTGISSCTKDNQDGPPAGGTDPNITVNFSVDSLLARCNGNPYLVTQNLIISGVVVADDSSGNFYKELDIEDSTGGIMLGIDGSYLYNLYPMGTRLFINLKGLYIVNNKGVVEIVAFVNADGTFTGIPTTVESQYITTGKWGISVAPKIVTVSQLNTAPNLYQSELVQLNNVQFAQTSLNQPYYVAANYGNATLRDCGGEDLVTVYTSAYADFATMNTPSGNGTFLGIWSEYTSASSGRTTYELVVRQPSDLSLNGTLCP